MDDSVSMLAMRIFPVVWCLCLSVKPSRSDDPSSCRDADRGGLHADDTEVVGGASLLLALIAADTLGAEEEDDADGLRRGAVAALLDEGVAAVVVAASVSRASACVLFLECVDSATSATISLSGLLELGDAAALTASCSSCAVVSGEGKSSTSFMRYMSKIGGKDVGSGSSFTLESYA